MVRLIRNIAVALLILAFSLPALGYIAGLVRGGDGISLTEKRELEARPVFDGDVRAYTAAFDSYLEDHFGFRMIMIRLARKIRDNFGENPPDVIFGQEGWLYLGSNRYRDEFEGNGLWDEAQVERWIASFTEVKNTLSDRDIPFVAFIAIDKSRAYPEFLPNDWDASGRRFRSTLHAHPNADETGLIDIEPLVMAAKDRGKLVFFRRDTHWTADGTYDLAMSVMDRLDPSMQRRRFLPDPPREQTITTVPDLDGMAGFETSQEPPFTMIDFPPSRSGQVTVLEPATEDDPKRGQFATLRILGTEDAPAGRLVIVGDSFADAMVGHFRPSFSEIVRIHHGAHYFDISLDDVLSYDPDAVLFVTAERQAAIKARPLAPLKATD